MFAYSNQLYQRHWVREREGEKSTFVKIRGLKIINHSVIDFTRTQLRLRKGGGKSAFWKKKILIKRGMYLPSLCLYACCCLACCKWSDFSKFVRIRPRLNKLQLLSLSVVNRRTIYDRNTDIRTNGQIPTDRQTHIYWPRYGMLLLP